MTLRLKTFGSVHLERDQHPLGGANSQRRRLALLTYLAAAGDKPVTRDKLMALLWPEQDDARGRHSLSQLLYAIRQDLGPEVVVSGADDVRLNGQIVTSDQRDFADALARGELESAVRMYRGPFLDSFHVHDAPQFERWAEDERVRLAASYGQALERLAEDAERRSDHFRAVEWWRCRAAVAPTDERVTLRLMRAHAAAGDRSGAIQAARVYEVLVRDEMETEPDPAISSFAERLRHEARAANADAGESTAAVTAPVSPALDQKPQPHGPIATPPSTPMPVASTGIPRWRSWRSVVAATAVVGLVALASTQLGGGRGKAETAPAQTVIVLGDLASSDSILALAIREALRAELANLRGVRILSDLGTRELTTLMRLPAGLKLRPPHLLAVAERGGANVAITGSVTPLGTGAQIIVEVMDPSTGNVLKTLSARPASMSEVVPSVAGLGRSIRSAIAGLPVDTTVRALPAVTTASLPALRSYALARRSAALRREDVIEHGERAVMHDTAFALAHYLLGDYLWFSDNQSHAEAHLERAYALIGLVPQREAYIVRARYLQLVRDRPDSSLVYWDLLRDEAPREPIAYEGRTWALRALGRYEEAAAAADTALRLEPAAIQPNSTNAVYSWLSAGDTTKAFAFARAISAKNPALVDQVRFHRALLRGELDSALLFADRGNNLSMRFLRRQEAYLIANDLARARINMDSLRSEDEGQSLPRALISQGWVEARRSDGRGRAAGYAREALAWVAGRDLSPPAVARLSERIGDVAARGGDTATVIATLDLVRKRDAGRGLPSYVLATRALDAEMAFARGDMAAAARLAASARRGVYFSRSLTTLVMLEADARRANGENDAAASLYSQVISHTIVDGDFEVWALLRGIAAREARAGRR